MGNETLQQWLDFIEKNKSCNWPLVQSAVEHTSKALEYLQYLCRAQQLLGESGYFAILPDEVVHLICEHLADRGAFKLVCKRFRDISEDLPLRAQGVFKFVIPQAAGAFWGEIKFTPAFSYAGIKWFVPYDCFIINLRRCLQFGHNASTPLNKRLSLFLVCLTKERLPFRAAFVLSVINKHPGTCACLY